MGQHHNPMDPRDPLAPALYFSLIDDGRSAGGRGGRPSGCGRCCLVLVVIVVIAVFIGWLTK